MTGHGQADLVVDFAGYGLWAKAEWGTSENNRRARFYTLTGAGRKQLTVERHEFDRLILAIHKVLNTA